MIAFPDTNANFPKLLTLHLAAYAIPAALLHENLSIAAVPLAALLIWPSITDIQRYEIPDLVSLLLIIAGLATGVFVESTNWIDRAAGAILWPGLFLIVGWGFRAHRGYPGLGFGDVKLMAGIGLWLGFTGAVYVVMAGTLSGMVFLALAGWRQGAAASEIPQLAIPFGTFLCFSAWVVWLFLGSP